MQKYFMGVIFTNHAIKRLYERCIAQSDAWYTLRRPDGSVKGKALGSYKFYKTYGPQRIEIVATQNRNKEWVVLSCWSKIIGTGKPIFTRRENPFWTLIKKVLKSVGKKVWQGVKKRQKSKKTEKIKKSSIDEHHPNKSLGNDQN